MGPNQVLQNSGIQMFTLRVKVLSLTKFEKEREKQRLCSNIKERLSRGGVEQLRGVAKLLPLLHWKSFLFTARES